MNIARPVTGYQGLVETCRARADELAISRLELDRLAGLPAGYSGKLLGNPDKARKPKRMWPGRPAPNSQEARPAAAGGSCPPAVCR